jgi:O-antigen/teichoic acid export membrane protein
MLARLRSLLNQSAVYSLGNIFTHGIKFLLLPLYTRFLTPADYGILAILGTYEMVLGILLSFGLQGSLTRLHYDFKDDETSRRGLYGSAWLFLTGSSLLLTLLVDWQGPRIFELFFPGVAYYPFGRLGTWISFFTLASIIPLVIFRVRQQAWYFIAATGGRLLLNTGAIIYFVAGRGEGALGSLKAQLIVSAAFFVIFNLISLRNLNLKFTWETLRGALTLGLPLIPHQLSNWALSLSDRIVLSHFVSMEQLGIYSLGYRVASILDMLFQSFNMAWAPLFYRMAAEEADAPRTFARLTTYYGIAAFSLTLGALLLFEDLLYLMARPAYYPSIPVMRVVVLGFLAHGFYFMVVNQLFYAKKVTRLPVYSGVAAGVNISLNLLTVPVWGIAAAAWNTVAGYLVLFVLVFVESNRVYPIPYEYGRLARLAIIALGVYLAGSLVHLDGPLLNLAARSLVILLYPLSLFALRFFTPREITGMRLLARQAIRPARRGL